MDRSWRNWAGNVAVTPARVAWPSSVAEVVDEVRSAVGAGLRIRAVGSGHSFTDVAVAPDVQVRPDRMTGLLSVDPAARLVTVRAGTTLRALAETLAEVGLALPNLGDIDAQTVAGALATGTHGTGSRFGGLATFVESLELVLASGEVLTCSATSRPDVFAAARVGLGALGIVTAVTLRCVDAFVLRAAERPGSLEAVLASFDRWAATDDHVEFYWMPYTSRTLVKRLTRDGDGRPLGALRAWWERDFLQNTAFGAVCRLARAVPSLAPGLMRATAAMVSSATYSARSDRIFTTPRRVRFVEMEYALPAASLPVAFDGLRRIIDALPFPVLFPVEVRVAAGDDIWLSHGYGRDSVYIAIHQYVGMPYEPYFRAFEEVCTGLDGRPHWGKLHWRDASSLRGVYPRFDDFLAVRDELDPDRVFANAYTDRVLGF